MTTGVSDADAQPWHALDVPRVLEALKTNDAGLSTAEARTRLAVTGLNAMPSPPHVSAWRVLIDQFRSVIVLLLLGAAAVAVLSGDLADGAAVGAVLLVNVLIGYAVEIGAHRAVEALARLESKSATVVRDRVPQEIDARHVVPGDVVILDEGQAVPADARLLEATELRVVESALTGESLPSAKSARAAIDVWAPLPERTTMVYMGTTAVAGAARGVVTATGPATELGRIGILVNTTKIERTPLQQRLDALGRQLVWVALIVGALTAVLAWWQRLPLGLVIQTGIALAVAAVPEGLPAVATITLALAVRRMARRNAIVRRLPAVETLGSVTVICTDKTGTLTAASMQVTQLRTISRAIEVAGHGYDPKGAFVASGRPVVPAEDKDLMMLLRIVAAANRGDAVITTSGWMPRGDPTEAALAVVARKGGIERSHLVEAMPEVGEVPFSSRRALMATFHRTNNGLTVLVKGAPEVVLELCGSVLDHGVARTIRAIDRLELVDANRDMAKDGLRVLAAAYGDVTEVSENALRNLTFVGFAGMIDAPAEGVEEAIRTFQSAGVRTVMITGDQQGTARAVARTLGLASDESPLLDGAEIDRMPDGDLEERLADTQVFSRVSPEAKLRIVAAFQRRGEIVAMLGDGVNDAATLKKAHIGVTMGGRGTDVAREAAAVVLRDDRFPTIAVAIEEGRVAFDNIRKFVFYLFSCNLAEIVVLLGASGAGLPTPLLPLQILWLNLVTDSLPALALAAEPGERDVMRRPPRNATGEIVSLMSGRSVVFYGLLLAVPVFLAMWLSGIRGLSQDRAMTVSFMVLSFAQLLHLGNARDNRAVLHPRRVVANVPALCAVLLTLTLQAATVLWEPLRAFLQLTPLTSSDWFVVVAVSAIPALMGQGIKVARADFSTRAQGNISRRTQE